MPQYSYLAVEGPHEVEFVYRLLRPFGFNRVRLETNLDSFFTAFGSPMLILRTAISNREWQPRCFYRVNPMPSPFTALLGTLVWSKRLRKTRHLLTLPL